MASVRFGAYTRRSDDVAYISAEHVIPCSVSLFGTVAILLVSHARVVTPARRVGAGAFASDRILTQGKRPWRCDDDVIATTVPNRAIKSGME